MNNQINPNVFIFTALECEAKAVVRFFNLKKDNDHHHFSIYNNQEIVLAVTGIGQVAMAAGVAYTLATFSRCHYPVLINIGIAGHKSASLGSLFIAMKISDKNTEKKYYPMLIGKNFPQTCEVETLSKPSTQYKEDSLFDMEAVAFYEIAVKFSTAELIHSLKIVSDNSESPINKIGKHLVYEWMADQMIEIERLLNHFLELREPVMPIKIENYSEIITQWHFTVSGKLRLKALMSRWQVLSASSWLGHKATNFSNAKDLMKALEADIKSLEVKL